MDTCVVTAHLPERHQLTLEALADVDAKRTADHAEIEGWIETLTQEAKARARR